MDPVAKALWFVESHSRELIGLDEIAASCHVSPFHLTRAFSAWTGMSLMRYVRARRLSEAARQLAAGAEDILGVALGAGYGSHEAFTRAFREQFAATPEQVRAQGITAQIRLTESLTMNISSTTEVLSPRFETIKPMVLAGLVERYSCQGLGGIPNQWQRFSAHLGRVPGQVGAMAFGASYNFDADGNLDYLSGVQVQDERNVPKELKILKVPANKYAVFRHKEHVASIRSTCAAIWSNWFPGSGYEPIEAPTLERYGPEFNPVTGLGGFEIWVAVKG